MSKIDDAFTFRTEAKVICRCGRVVVFGYVGEQEEPTVLHPQKPCPFFIETDMWGYLRGLRAEGK